jgi:hypothetical protein
LTTIETRRPAGQHDAADLRHTIDSTSGPMMENGSPPQQHGELPLLSRTGFDSEPADQRLREEIKTCRSIANRCAFVIGPARSGTTILAQIVNANDRAFLTTEANYYLGSAYPDFREWYNHQHQTYGNQASKSSYAPDLSDPGEHQWWQWLARAAFHFDLVGDKMAYTDFDTSRHDPNKFMSFFESRFFESRYMFIFRDPVQTMLSSAVLWDRDPRSFVASWASIVKLWADFIRVFPFTMTILHAELNDAKIAEIGVFLGLDLSASARLLDHREQRRHRSADIADGPFVTRIRPLLEMIYSEIKETVSMERVLLQADQKRDRYEGGQRPKGSSSSDIAVVSTPVGRAWNLADQLVSGLRDHQANTTP